MSTIIGVNNRIDIGWRSEFCAKKTCETLPSSAHCSSPVTQRPHNGEQVSRSHKNNCSQISSATFRPTSWPISIMPTPPNSPPPGFSSGRGLLTGTTTKLGLRNLLKVPTSNAEHFFLTRQCSYIFYCCRLKVDFNYPNVENKYLIKDDRVQEAIERVVSEEMEESGSEATTSKKIYSAFVSQQTRKAIQTLNDMKAALSSTLIRLTGYVLFKVFNHLFMSVTITEGQMQMIDIASKRNLPLIFVPLHRSHVDYLFVTWILFNRQVPAPIVAAGENLRMPVFGCLLRGLGGFFIKRRLDSTKSRKDIVYRSLLQTYMTQSLKAGFNLEFFIEGGRTRTGKACLPKGGLLSVIVDAYLNGTLNDALIVPIAINYDKLVDGNFIKEQLGQSKVPESFWRAVRAIVKVLSTSFGHSRIDFSQPFSLKEFFQSSKLFLPRQVTALDDNLAGSSELGDKDTDKSHCQSISSTNGKCHSRSTSSTNRVNGSSFHATRSCSSLFGTEVTEDYRVFVKSLATHIVYDAEKCQAIMSTNAISWLLTFQFRDGTNLSTLADALSRLRDDLRLRNRDTGFSGDSLDVTIHAVSMLGESLVYVKGDVNGDPASVFVRPVTSLPNIIEVNYYANALAPLYALDAVVATSLVGIANCNLWNYKDVPTECSLSLNKLVKRSKRLCEIMQHEFIFVPPCNELETKIHESIDRFTLSNLLVNKDIPISNSWSRRKHFDTLSDDDSDEYGTDVDTSYTLSPTSSNLEMVSVWTKSLGYIVDSYYVTLLNLPSLIGKSLPEKDFIHSTQNLITSMLRKGTLSYGESIAVEPIRNSLKHLESERVIETYMQDGIKFIYITKRMASEEQLTPLIVEMESFRVR